MANFHADEARDFHGRWTRSLAGIARHAGRELTKQRLTKYVRPGSAGDFAAYSLAAAAAGVIMGPAAILYKVPVDVHWGVQIAKRHAPKLMAAGARRVGGFKAAIARLH